MRRYIRHPSDIPIRFGTEGSAVRSLRDVGYGGLCFVSPQGLAPGQVLRLSIDKVVPPFHTRGRVSWCQPEADHYLVGVEFLDQEAAYRARMVEQVCHIEHYRREVWRREGRRLSAEQAAGEWIDRHAADFPPLESAPADLPTAAGGGVRPLH